MKVPDYVNSILERFSAAGFRAYPVGGCVRDLLLGKTPDDWDLTTDAKPEEMLALFGPAAHPTGLPHGTVTVVSAGHSVEITTMRRDGAYRDNRHPESVMFTDRIEEDLARRDLTVNAMALAVPRGEEFELSDGTVIDPFGGRADLVRRVLRCVGDAHQRFSEDALRILRLLRFASVPGFDVEAETAAAARETRARLASVASERVYAELCKLLCGENVTRVLLDFPDVLGVVIPELLPGLRPAQSAPLLRRVGAYGAERRRDPTAAGAALDDAVPRPRQAAVHDDGRGGRGALLRAYGDLGGDGGGDHGAAAL